MEQTRKTVGAIASELMQKTSESNDPIELQREMHKDYLKNLLECAQEFKKNTTGNFFIVVLTKRERLMPNVFRNYFTARLSCPTPNYDQALYMYRAADEEIIFLWAIPDRETCYYLKANASYVAPEEKDLLRCVIDFSDGTLFEMSKKLNKEREDSILKEK